MTTYSLRDLHDLGGPHRDKDALKAKRWSACVRTPPATRVISSVVVRRGLLPGWRSSASY